MAQNFPPVAIPVERLTALILAGGEGRRAGDRDKGTLAWHGRPLVARVQERIAPQVGRILISCNRNEDFYAAYADLTIPDLREDHLGPLAGLEAAAPHIDTDFVLVVPCDTPRLPADLVQRLLTALLAEDLEGCHARSAGRDHYLCALLRSACLPSVSAYLDAGGRAVRHWLAQHRVRAVEFEDPESFDNINEP